MPTITIEQLKDRTSDIKATLWTTNSEGQTYAKSVAGASQATVSVLSLIYGNPSTQLSLFLDRLKSGLASRDSQEYYYNQRVASEIERILDQGIADYEAGFTGSVRVQAKGEVLGDFVALAREALSSGDTMAERVAAVLSAAALEETLKQIGESSGVDVVNRDMRGVIQKLKDAGILAGAQSGLASGLVKFRDHAFHGQFDRIERATVDSALSFVDGLLLSRFS
jgi:hypothetical protein